jgi:oxepin-CoA hydrolase/3-oxo-5,6-dehydrosuberyl-CoA semialdehyde dehydrogenase
VKSIHFDVDDAALRDEFLRTILGEALASLQPQEPPRWGAMAAQEMVEHLLWSVELSTGRAQADCPIPEEQWGRMRTFLYKNAPMPHEFMNPLLTDGLPPLRYPGLPQATAALEAEAKRFLEQAARGSAATHQHPVFGPIGDEEWSRAHFKHGCHHLQQFGLIETVFPPR